MTLPYAVPNQRGHTPSNDIYAAFWKRRNHLNRKQFCSCQGLGGGEGPSKGTRELPGVMEMFCVLTPQLRDSVCLQKFIKLCNLRVTFTVRKLHLNKPALPKKDLHCNSNICKTVCYTSLHNSKQKIL